MAKKKPVKKPKVVKIAYKIEDASFGYLSIRKTANAWWLNREKVLKLIQGLKMDCKPAELRLLAGISRNQYDYFMKIHPEFSAIFEDFRSNPVLRARATVYSGLNKDANIAFKYLERKAPDEFKEKTEIELKKQPILIDDIMGDINDEEE